MAESQKKNTKTYNFKIAGVSYKIKTSHDEIMINELINVVNQKMSEAMVLTNNTSFQNAAILSVLNMAEELILLKKKAHTELEKLEAKALKLSEDLENSKLIKENWN
jgi:cell division protein ZapA